MSEQNTVETSEQNTVETSAAQNEEATPPVDPCDVVADEKAAETEARAKTDAARKKELAAALVAYGKAWVAHEEDDRAWLYKVGAMTADCLNLYCEVEGWTAKSRKEGIDAICESVLSATGEVRREEISRALGIYHAAEYFKGAEHKNGRKALGARFLSLPLNTQKGFCLLFKRDLDVEKDDKGQETCKEVWRIIDGPPVREGSKDRQDVTDSVWHLIAIMFSESASPSHLKGKIKRVPLPGKGKKAREDVGTAYGADGYRLCSKFKDYCQGEGKNPLTEFVPDAVKAPAGKNGKANAGKKDEEKTPRGEQGATGERPEGQEPIVRLDVKPEIAAADTVEAIANHENPAELLYAIGKSDEVTSDAWLSHLVMGMVEAKRVKELQKLAMLVTSALKKLRAN